ncbi:MAG TPA: hypothetical protein VFE29_09230 [Terriglobia bacterium]|nr:hypothetical protein [Terriglobia bacterium]
MEPLDDKELNELLQRWKAPGAPASLRKRLAPKSPSLWHWLLKGSIRIPVPVGLVAIVLLALWILAGEKTSPPMAQPGGSMNLADFQPVRQLEPRIVGRAEESKNDENIQIPK